MPNFALHELAHAYHHRVLDKGYDNAEIKAAYKRAKTDGLYDRVEQRFGDGRSETVRAYAITNPQAKAGKKSLSPEPITNVSMCARA